MKTLTRKRPPKTLLLVLSPAIAFSVDAFITPSLFTSATRRAHPFASIHTTGHSSSFGSSNNKGALFLFSSSSSNNDNDNDNHDDKIDSSEPTPPVPPETISQTNCWNPMLRRVLASLSTLGMAETAYITYEKLYVTNGIQHICGTDGEGCGSVLDGPYATLHLGNAMEIPLSALGFLAYFVTTALALVPLFNQQKSASTPSTPNEDLDTTNRILLLSLTTAMGTFSVFLMSLLFGVLHTTCPFCIVSAILSISLATLSWVGGMIPPNQTKQAAQSALASFTATTIAALLFFFSVDEAVMVAPYNAPPQQLLASTSSPSDTSTTVRTRKQETNIAPPPITTTSTDRTLSIASDLKSLHAKMYGAYWCSHCYEQKQRLGAEAFTQIQYVECAREGLNSQRDLCNARDVPGYPTWEIDGKLYPGERELDELEDLVRQVRDTIEQGGGGS